MKRTQPPTKQSFLAPKKPRKSHVKDRPTTKAQRVKRMNKLEGITKEVKKDQEKFFTNHPKEAKFWEARSSAGRKPVFKTPDHLFKCCMEYIEWVHNNPFYEYKVCGLSEGIPVIDHIPKKRPLTIGSLIIFLDISIMSWLEYRKNKGSEFSYICDVVDEMIRQQKFGGAAAGFFNHAIIARDLGLVDRQDMTSGGKPIENSTVNIDIGMDVKEAEKLYKNLLLAGKVTE